MRSQPCTPAVALLALCITSCGDDGASSGASSTSATASGSTAGSEDDEGSASSATTAPGGESSGVPPQTGTTDPSPGDTTDGDTTTTTSGGSGEESSHSGSTGDPVEPPPPTGGAELLPWLEGGTYADWAAEAEPHPSAGPHFTAVRTFVNPALLESLEGGGGEHPVGAAVVKELFGAGPDVGGWAVMVKVAPGSDAASWYWYEWFQGTTYADDTDVGGCGDCHADGVDFIRTTLPL